jgi:hypothetical protein
MLFTRDPVPKKHALLLSLQVEHAHASWSYLAVHWTAVDTVLMLAVASLVFLNGDGVHGCCLQGGSVGSKFRHVLGFVVVSPKQALQRFVNARRHRHSASTIFLVLLEGPLDLLVQPVVLVGWEKLIVDMDAFGENLSGL